MLTGPILGYESLWFLGDEFMMRSFQKHYKDRDHAEYAGYCWENFEISAFMTDRFMSNNRNMVSRLQHCFAKAISDKILLPKMVITVLDNDLIKYFGYTDGEEGLTKPLGRILDSLMKEFQSMATTQKDFLPKKAKRADYPRFIWIEAPLHKNFDNNMERRKFNCALNDVVKFHEGHYALQLKKIWDSENSNLFFPEFRRYGVEGYNKYWMTVDATIKFADTILLKKKPQNPISSTGGPNNHYKWVCKSSRENDGASGRIIIGNEKISSRDQDFRPKRSRSKSLERKKHGSTDRHTTHPERRLPSPPPVNKCKLQRSHHYY